MWPPQTWAFGEPLSPSSQILLFWIFGFSLLANASPEESERNCTEFALTEADENSVVDALSNTHPRGPTDVRIGSIRNIHCQVQEMKITYAWLLPHHQVGKDQRSYVAACFWEPSKLSCQWKEQFYLVRKEVPGPIELESIEARRADEIVSYLLTLDRGIRFKEDREVVSESISRITHIFGHDSEASVIFDGKSCSNWNVRVKRKAVREPAEYRLLRIGRSVC